MLNQVAGISGVFSIQGAVQMALESVPEMPRNLQLEVRRSGPMTDSGCKHLDITEGLRELEGKSF